MSKYKVGETVIYVNSNEKGIVVEVCPPARGRQLYKVSINNTISNCLEGNLMADVDLTDPFKRLEQGVFGSYLDFSRLNTSNKIKNTSTNTISTLKASNTIFKAYQFKPLLKFLNSENRRILVADEVGLGKTIEAGHIMLELRARGELKNALILSPKSLQEKWQSELKLKFNLDFKIYESQADFISDLKNKSSSLKAIINYEKIRPSKKSKNSDSQEQELKKDSVISLLQEHNLHFDFVLCDEAHRLRNSTTKLFKGISTLIDHCKAAVFLTATPIMISELNLFNLLKLLDPIKYSEYSTFQNQLAVNRPFIQALSLLNRNASFEVILKHLTETKVNIHYSYGEDYQVQYISNPLLSELFAEIPLYIKIIEDLTNNIDNTETRVQLQYDLSDMSELNRIFSRTRKVDVTQDWSQAIREPQTNLIQLDELEQAEFDKVIEEYEDQNSFIDFEGQNRMASHNALGLVQKKRQFSSSVYATLNAVESLENGVDEYAEYRDSKVDELLKIIDNVCVKNGNKLIVFAIFIKTLKYLKIRLKKAGIETIQIDGSIKDRYNEIQKFKSDPSIKVLLSSEVGSEGLDMQFCDTLVNYDLPWNPMVVEQRIGRIDRFGQQSPVVHIFNFVVKNSIQEEIYTRLLDRIGIFRNSIGDLEAILDKDLDVNWSNEHRNLREYFSSLEKEFYSKKISKELRELKYEQIQRAVLIEQRNLKEISEGLTDTLTNDVYFKNEIQNIEKNNRYVTEKELANYLGLLFTNHLSTCEFNEIDSAKMLYQIRIPLSVPRTLVNFMNENRPVDPEMLDYHQKFILSITNETTIDLTFSQEVGYLNEKLIRINTYHPLILAAFNHFSKTEKNHENTFKFKLSSDQLSPLTNGLKAVVLAQYKCVIVKKWHERESTSELIIPLAYNLKSKAVISNKTIGEEIYGAMQTNARAIPVPLNLNEEEIQEISYAIAEEISFHEQEIIDDYKMRLESTKKMQAQRLEEYFLNRIKNQEMILDKSYEILKYSSNSKDIKNTERILPVQKKQLENLHNEKEDALKNLADSKIVSKTPELLSLSLILID